MNTTVLIDKLNFNLPLQCLSISGKGRSFTIKSCKAYYNNKDDQVYPNLNNKMYSHLKSNPSIKVVLDPEMIILHSNLAANDYSTGSESVTDFLSFCNTEMNNKNVKMYSNMSVAKFWFSYLNSDVEIISENVKFLLELEFLY